MNLPDKRYKVIYADPPWNYGGKPSGNAPWQSVEYDTMTRKELLSLPVVDIADDSCVLFLWTTGATMVQAIELIEAWGFQYVTVGFVYNKITKTGKPGHCLGKWTLPGAEFCLIGKHGRIYSEIIAKNQRQVVTAPGGAGSGVRHSAKPVEVRSRIEAMFEGPRIELFARERVDGWDCWGNEV